MTEPNWLPLEEVLEINHEAVAETRESHFLRDQGLLEGALARPKNHYHYNGVDDMVILAVVLLSGIAQNHPFEQGNKRTAFTAAVMFLLANGYDLVAIDSEQFGELITRFVAGAIGEESFIELMRAFIAPICGASIEL